MRIWSIHPKYLDCKGLVALWREALLARKVLEGRTKGYRHHPELKKFSAARDPVKAANAYLFFVWKESARRGYCFDKSKLYPGPKSLKIPISGKIVKEEFSLLKKKTNIRSPETYRMLLKVKRPFLHPIFRAS